MEYPERFEQLIRRNQARGHDDKVEDLEETYRMGVELSKILHCPVRWPAFDHDSFMCNCGISFPTFAVKAGMVKEILERHEVGEDG